MLSIHEQLVNAINALKGRIDNLAVQVGNAPAAGLVLQNVALSVAPVRVGNRVVCELSQAVPIHTPVFVSGTANVYILDQFGQSFLTAMKLNACAPVDPDGRTLTLLELIMPSRMRKVIDRAIVPEVNEIEYSHLEYDGRQTFSLHSVTIDSIKKAVAA